MFPLIAYVMQRNCWNLINPLQMAYRFTYKNIMARRSPFIVLFHRAFGLSIRGIFLLPLSLAARSLRQLKESKHRKKNSHSPSVCSGPTRGISLVEIGDITLKSSTCLSILNSPHVRYDSRT